jgi:uncharacterized protein (TIGR03083 family)
LPDKADVIACLENIRAEIDAVAGEATPETWSAGTYEDGWTAKNLLAHIASTSAPASYLLTMARLDNPPAAATFDNDAFNRDQVAMRKGRPVGELVDEIRANVQRDLQAIEAADDELLQKHFVAPWGSEGPVAQVIIDSVNGHLGGHIADLRGALQTAP